MGKNLTEKAVESMIPQLVEKWKSIRTFDAGMKIIKDFFPSLTPDNLFGRALSFNTYFNAQQMVENFPEAYEVFLNSSNVSKSDRDLMKSNYVKNAREKMMHFISETV